MSMASNKKKAENFPPKIPISCEGWGWNGVNFFLFCLNEENCKSTESVVALSSPPFITFGWFWARHQSLGEPFFYCVMTSEHDESPFKLEPQYPSNPPLFYSARYSQQQQPADDLKNNQQINTNEMNWNLKKEKKLNEIETHTRPRDWCACWRWAALRWKRCTSRRPCRNGWLYSGPDESPPIRLLCTNKSIKMIKHVVIKKKGVTSYWFITPPQQETKSFILFNF